jgi:hypothetical protein
MPFSESPPDIVMPATPEGYDDAARAVWDVYVGHCQDFSEDVYTFSYEGRRCNNRDPFGHRRHNWCYRCTAGYLLSKEDDPYADSLQGERVIA